MAGYEQLLSELGGGEGGRELQALVSGILGGSGPEHGVSGSRGRELLRGVLDGFVGSPAAGGGSNSTSATSSTVVSALRSLGDSSPLPSLEGSPSRVIDGGDAVPFPLGGTARLLSGLFGIFQRDSGTGQADGFRGTAFEMPAARMLSLAIGSDRQASTEFDYRFDGQPRRSQQEWLGERRVEIHIQALDARSILDRKEELAEAVRQAMSSSGSARETLLGY